MSDAALKVRVFMRFRYSPDAPVWACAEEVLHLTYDANRPDELLCLSPCTRSCRELRIFAGERINGRPPMLPLPAEVETIELGEVLAAKVRAELARRSRPNHPT